MQSNAWGRLKMLTVVGRYCELRLCNRPDTLEIGNIVRMRRVISLMGLDTRVGRGKNDIG
jgi:hypothetical protein